MDASSARMSRHSCDGRPCASRRISRSPSPSLNRRSSVGAMVLAADTSTTTLKRDLYPVRIAEIRAENAILALALLQGRARTDGSVSHGNRVKPSNRVQQIAAFRRAHVVNSHHFFA